MPITMSRWRPNLWTRMLNEPRKNPFAYVLQYPPEQKLKWLKLEGGLELDVEELFFASSGAAGGTEYKMKRHNMKGLAMCELRSVWKPAAEEGQSKNASDWRTIIVNFGVASTRYETQFGIRKEDFSELVETAGICPHIWQEDLMGLYGVVYSFDEQSKRLSILFQVNHMRFAVWIYDPVAQETLCISCLESGGDEWAKFVPSSCFHWLQHPMGLFMLFKHRTYRWRNRQQALDLRNFDLILNDYRCLKDRRALKERIGRLDGNLKNEELGFVGTYSQAYGGLPDHIWHQVLVNEHVPPLKDLHEDMLKFDQWLEDNSRYRVDANMILSDKIRVKQSQILSELTQEDTEISIAIAAESKHIALLALRDGSSMKIIAMMTMLFFPATFFATFFAIPGMEWGDHLRDEHHFWVYIVCSVVATTIVLAVWHFGIKAAESRAIEKIKRSIDELQNTNTSRSLVDAKRTADVVPRWTQVQRLMKRLSRKAEAEANDAVGGADQP